MRDLLRTRRRPGATLLDVGSVDVNGTYRPIAEAYGFRYTGLDVGGHANVDVVGSAYALPFADESFDFVISGQLLEHLEDPIKAVEEIVRVAREWVILIAPFVYEEHRYPVDCWRVLPDAMRYMLSSLQDVESQIVGRDTYGVGRKVCSGLV